MPNKNLVEFYVVNGCRIFTEHPRAVAQAKLWGGNVTTFPIFSQTREDWEQTNGFELIGWGNPATCRTPKPRQMPSTPDAEYLEFAVNDMRMPR